MNCHEHALTLMDMARGAPVGDLERTAALEHVQRCSRCAAVLQNERALSGGLRALAAGVELPANASLERRLLDGFRADPVWEAEPWWRVTLKAAAAVLLVTGGMLAAWRDYTQLPRHPAPPPRVEFVPWPGVAALPAFESGDLVRTELPVSVLPVLGFEVPAGPAAGTVTADLLVGQDGLVRAVRLAN
jgi:hypothetical protein